LVRKILATLTPYGRTLRELKLSPNPLKERPSVIPSLRLIEEAAFSQPPNLTDLELIAPPSSAGWAIIVAYPNLRNLKLNSRADNISPKDCFGFLRQSPFPSLKYQYFYDIPVSTASALLKNISSHALISVYMDFVRIDHAS
jgi:hypothetical protein